MAPTTPGSAILTVLLLGAALALAPVRATGQESNSDGSIEVGLWKRLNANDMLYFPMSVTRASEVDHAEALVGTGYDHVLNDILAARLGYRYIWELSPPTGTAPFREHRGVAELFARTPVGVRFQLLDRTRLELRAVQGAAMSWRLRNRIRAGRTVELRRERTLTPYGSLEAGYDSRFRTVNRYRFSLGVAARLGSRFSPDLYVARQHDTRENTGPPASVGATLNFFL